MKVRTTGVMAWIVALLVGPQLHASGWAISIVEAQSASDLGRLRSQLANDEVLELTCRRELKRTRIPQACFALIKRQSARGHGVHRSLSKLEQVCLRVSLGSVDSESLQQVIQNPDLGPRCLRHLKGHLQILQYQELERPETWPGS